MTAFNAVDLSRLPAPNAVQSLDFESVFQSMLAEFIALDPSFSALVESDPVYKLLQLCAYREIRMRAEHNDGVRAVMPALATGPDLDQIAARYFTQRLQISPGDPQQGIAPLMESDEDLRRRMMLAFEGFSTAGPEGAYVFHTLSAHPGVLDASAFSPTPGQVVVTVLGRDAPGAPSQTILDAVVATLTDDDVRPLTDQVTVQAAAIIQYAVDATIYTFAGPGSQVVIEQATQRLTAYVADSRRLGRDITRSGVFAALHVAGVQRVVLASPAADVVCTRSQAAHSTDITITFGGVDE